MSGYTDAKTICYVTMNPSHSLVREHIRAGGRACALEAGVNGHMITLYDKGSHIPLMWTHLIPATLEGRALHNVQNAMFAAAMAYSLGIKLDAIRQGLRTFDTTFFQAPGRMNVFEEHRSEEHTSEIPSLMRISYAVFCLKKKKSETLH